MAYLQNTSIVGTLNVSDVSTFSSSGGIRFNDTMINIGASLAATASGANSIAIGYNASATGKYGVAIGSGATATTGTALNCNGATSYIWIGSGGSVWLKATSASSGLAAASSDRRDKTDFEKIDNGLKFINSLNPITYCLNTRDSYIDEENDEFLEEEYKNETRKGHRRQPGFIAQEVYDSLISVYGSDNYAQVVDYNKYDGDNSERFDRYYLYMHNIVPFLVEAVQEQSVIIKNLENRINDLEKRLENK